MKSRMLRFEPDIHIEGQQQPLFWYRDTNTVAGGKVPDRKKANEAVESQRGVKWEVAADLKGWERFSPVPATKKPDLAIWNEEEKEVHLVELTVPHEDNINSAHERKDTAMRLLLKNVRRHFPVKVRCRGFIATSTTKWMEWQDLVQRKETPQQKLFKRLLRKQVTGYG